MSARRFGVGLTYDEWLEALEDAQTEPAWQRRSREQMERDDPWPATKGEAWCQRRRHETTGEESERWKAAQLNGGFDR